MIVHVLKREPIPLFIFFTRTQRERPTFTDLLPYESKHLGAYLIMIHSESHTLRSNPKTATYVYTRFTSIHDFWYGSPALVRPIPIIKMNMRIEWDRLYLTYPKIRSPYFIRSNDHIVRQPSKVDSSATHTLLMGSQWSLVPLHVVFALLMCFLVPVHSHFVLMD